MSENSDKQHKKSFDWLNEYKWQKGQSGNPKGRPKTKTLKEFAREFLSSMSEEARIEYLSKIDPDIVWKMAEGNPKQDVETEVKGDIKIGISEKIANKYGINDTTQDTE